MWRIYRTYGQFGAQVHMLGATFFIFLEDVVTFAVRGKVGGATVGLHLGVHRFTANLVDLLEMLEGWGYACDPSLILPSHCKKPDRRHRFWLSGLWTPVRSLMSATAKFEECFQRYVSPTLDPFSSYLLDRASDDYRYWLEDFLYHADIPWYCMTCTYVG